MDIGSWHVVLTTLPATLYVRSMSSMVTSLRFLICLTPLWRWEHFSKESTCTKSISKESTRIKRNYKWIWCARVCLSNTGNVDSTERPANKPLVVKNNKNEHTSTFHRSMGKRALNRLPVSPIINNTHIIMCVQCGDINVPGPQGWVEQRHKNMKMLTYWKKHFSPETLQTEA